jgi:hypothetical protein
MPGRWLSVRALLCSAAVVGVLAVPGGSADAVTKAPKQHSVYVTRSGGITIDVFRDAKCTVAKRTGFTAVSKRLGATLRVRIEPFDGFHDYDLKAGSIHGPRRTTFVDLSLRNREYFASNFVPPHKSIVSEGGIRFSDNHALIGAGFQPMFDASGGDAVIVTGVMTCHYPKTRGRGK